MIFEDFITICIAWVAVRCTAPWLIAVYLLTLALCITGFTALACWVLRPFDRK